MASLAGLAAAHGVATSYRSPDGRPVPVPEATLAAVLDALGADTTPDAALPLPPTVALSRAGTPPRLGDLPPGTALRVVTEEGRELSWEAGSAAPPGGLPPGYHTLHARAPDGRTARATLIAPPAALPPAPDHPRHGLLTSLGAVLSARSWGMGDLVDLADLASWAGHVLGSGFLQVTPIHAAVPGATGDRAGPSPYRPATRSFPDPVHLRIEDIPEYPYLPPADLSRLEPLRTRAAALRQAVLGKGMPLDRDAVWALKRQALEIVRAVPLSPGRLASYHAYLASRGQALEDHATWCALAELYGPDWRFWPPALRDPRSPATARARADHLERIDFHSWLAWLTDMQLARVHRAAQASGVGIGLIHELATGVHPHGSDAWTQQEFLARGMSVGAPPDADHPAGRDFGLPPWRPGALALAGYRPFRDLLSGSLRNAGGLCVGHVTGLLRQWWIPDGATPDQGTYVSCDADALLGTLAIEAHRAGAVIVADEAGEAGEELTRHGLICTSVLWAGRDAELPGRPPLPPERWPAGSLAAVTTPGRPTAAARLALPSSAAWLDLFARRGLLPRGADEEQRIAAAYRFLAHTPARLVGIWLGDAVGDRRSLPRLPLADASGRAVPLEELTVSARVVALLRAVREEMAG